MNYLRFSAIALLCSTTLYLNACSRGTSAQSKSVPNAQVSTAPEAGDALDSQCDALDMATFQLNAALGSMEMSTSMGSGSMLKMHLDRADQEIAKVKALKITQPAVNKLKVEYLGLVDSVLKLARPAANESDTKLKAIAPTLKSKVEMADKFRSDKIFFGDCKK